MFFFNIGGKTSNIDTQEQCKCKHRFQDIFVPLSSQVEVPMIYLRGKNHTYTYLPSVFTPKIIGFSSGSVFFINTPNSPFSTLLFNRLSNALPRQFAQLRQFHHGSYRVLSQFFFQCLWPEEQSRSMPVWLAVFNHN